MRTFLILTVLPIGCADPANRHGDSAPSEVDGADAHADTHAEAEPSRPDGRRASDAELPADAGPPQNDDQASPVPDEAEDDAAELPVQPQPADTYPTLRAAQIPTNAERLRDGFGLAESPVWDHCTGHLYVADVDRNVIHQLAPGGAFTTLMSATHYANGMALHHDGSLILAQMGGGKGGRLSRRAPDGTLTVLADRNASGGALRTVDDVVVRSDGTMYFSDAVFPHGPYLGFSFAELPVWILPPGASTVVRGPSVPGPNGVELSPDEKTFYLSSYFDAAIYAYDVAADGSLSRKRTVATRLSKSDSFCLDAAGNLYAGVEDGLQVLRADGTKLKLIRIRSGHGTTNCTFGGPDGKTLYITSYEALWRVPNMPIPGLDFVKHQRVRTCPSASP